tara:strand:+ start:31 stop:261 length:231 start_codon:yes stop_codon:yes gene_type:complete
MVKNKEEIIYYLANKYELPVYKVKEMVNYQFKFVSETIKKGNFDAVRLPYFGKFFVKNSRVKYINKLKDEATVKKI